MSATAECDTHSTLPKAVAEMRASQRQSTDNQQSGRTVSYTYDSLHRLKTSVTNGSGGYPQWGLSWSYDRYGNRTGQSVTHGSGPSSSPTISTTTNRVTALGGSTYYYDSNGNNTQDDLFKYKYDAENRVVEIRNLSDTLLSSYAYDGKSMQVIKVVGSTRNWFLYAGTQLVSEFADLASATYTSPTSPGSLPSDSISILLYQHADHLTTRVTTDNAGSLSNQQAHYPYGENWYNTGTADPSVNRKFTSYRKETDSSLASGQINYAIARYHGARIGRFERPLPRPTQNPQGLNGYAYGTNNPISSSGTDAPPMADEGNPVGTAKPVVTTGGYDVGGGGSSEPPDILFPVTADSGWLGGLVGGSAAGWGSWGDPNWVYGIPVGGSATGGSGSSGAGTIGSGQGGRTIQQCSREFDSCVSGGMANLNGCNLTAEVTFDFCVAGCAAACDNGTFLFSGTCFVLCSGTCAAGKIGMTLECDRILRDRLKSCEQTLTRCLDQARR